MPTLIRIAVMPVIVEVGSMRVSVIAHFFAISPIVPVMTIVPVTVVIAIRDIAEANTDANTADMDADSNALRRGGARRRKRCADQRERDKRAIEGFEHDPFLPDGWQPPRCFGGMTAWACENRASDGR